MDVGGRSTQDAKTEVEVEGGVTKVGILGDVWSSYREVRNDE